LKFFKNISLVFSLVLSLAALSACVSFNGQETAPEITSEMSLDAKLASAIDFGGNTFKQVVKHISDNNEWSKTERVLTSLIIANSEYWQDAQILNASKLYERSGAKNVDLVFLKLLKINKPLTIKMGWNLLRFADGAKYSQIVDSVLSQSIIDGNLDQHLIPEMANAVSYLDVKSVYGIVKLGLMKKGEPEFVVAMTKLYPHRSSDDLFDYLVLANNEELRQRALKSINTLTALQILEYLSNNPVSFGHKDLGKVFVYAASRNIGLRQTARLVVDVLVSQNSEILAYELSKQPKWVQISIIESARREMTSNTKLLLKRLKEMTPDTNIEEEISLLKI
jgi:hypothetical protein